MNKENNKEELTLSEREELEKLRKEKNLKERLYDKIEISVKTLDRIIIILIAAFIIIVICGIIAGK